MTVEQAIFVSRLDGKKSGSLLKWSFAFSIKFSDERPPALCYRRADCLVLRNPLLRKSAKRLWLS